MARARILEGAVTALAEKGLDATVEDIAEAARVSRRTVFRHFATHGDLLVAALAEVIDAIGAHIRTFPPPGEDVEAWLTEFSVALHALLRRVIGRAFWDIHVQRPGTAPVVTAALADWLRMREGFAQEVATTAWRAMGGKKAPPPWVIDAFVLQLSAFATNAMVAYSPEEAGQVSARILWAVLTTALAGERRDGRGARRPSRR